MKKTKTIVLIAAASAIALQMCACGSGSGNQTVPSKSESTSQVLSNSISSKADEKSSSANNSDDLQEQEYTLLSEDGKVMLIIPSSVPDGNRIITDKFVKFLNNEKQADFRRINTLDVSSYDWYRKNIVKNYGGTFSYTLTKSETFEAGDERIPRFWQLYDRPCDFSTYNIPWNDDKLRLEKIVADEIELKYDGSKMADYVVISGISHGEWLFLIREASTIEGFISVYDTP